MKSILGKKVQMTEIFTDKQTVEPVTLVAVLPTVVTQLRSVAKDGYQAVQVGYGYRKPKNINEAQKGQMKDLGSFAGLMEFRDVKDKNVGDKITVDMFKVGEEVTVTGISKGKGFQGVVKRHGFKGGQRTHGQKHSEREPGSIGGGLRTHVPKNMRMAGRMGGDTITVKNLTVVHIDAEKGELYLRGAVPGRRGTLIEISSNA